MIRCIGFGFGFLVMLGCNASPDKPMVTDPVQLKADLIDANKILSDNEAADIARYAARQGWAMDSTGTGLHYLIYKKGEGAAITAGQVVRYNFEVRLLTGVVCYTSATLGPRSFKVGQGGVESGLEEAMPLLHVGDRAKLILPSHLAHGLPGDGNLIPRKAVLVYDIEMLSAN